MVERAYVEASKPSVAPLDRPIVESDWISTLVALTVSFPEEGCACAVTKFYRVFAFEARAKFFSVHGPPPIGSHGRAIR
jgi:hypothetical protein